VYVVLVCGTHLNHHIRTTTTTTTTTNNTICGLPPGIFTQLLSTYYHYYYHYYHYYYHYYHRWVKILGVSFNTKKNDEMSAQTKKKHEGGTEGSFLCG